MQHTDPPTLPALMQDLAVAVLVHHPQTGAILDVNDAAESLYGYATSELTGLTVGDVTAPSTSFSQGTADARIEAAANGAPQDFEWRIERANGERRWVDVHLDRTTIDGHDVVLAEVRDVTASRARERRLRLLSRIVRHNLRNEMNVLQGHARRLEQALEADTLMDDVDVILDIATDVGALSESISQIEEIVTPDATERSRTNLAAVVADVATRAADEHPDATVVVDGASEAWVVADRGLEYAIAQAVENAIEHTDRDAPRVELTVEDDPADDTCIVHVADDAPHIPDVEVDVLDEDADTSTTNHGSGVGLWVMQWCVDSLGGTLAIDTPGDRGNVVSLSLPRVREPPRP